MLPPLKILIVDDNPAFIQAITYFLTTEPGLSVVGHALSGLEALEQVQALQPDLVLLDYVMPGMNGLAVTQQLKTRPAPPKVVIVTMHDIPEYQFQAQTAQADGFISKAQLGDRLFLIIDKLFPDRGTGDAS